MKLVWLGSNHSGGHGWGSLASEWDTGAMTRLVVHQEWMGIEV